MKLNQAQLASVVEKWFEHMARLGLNVQGVDASSTSFASFECFRVTALREYYINPFGCVISKCFLNTILVIKPYINAGGYLVVRTGSKYTLKRLYVHRLAAMCFVENPNNLPIVNHKDANKKNCFVENLEWTDHIGNMEHVRFHRLIKPKGRTLSEDEILDLKELGELGFSVCALAKSFKIGIGRVKNYLEVRA